MKVSAFCNTPSCIGLARTVYIHTVYDIFCSFPAKSTVHTLYLYGSGQPYLCTYMTLLFESSTSFLCCLHCGEPVCCSLTWPNIFTTRFGQNINIYLRSCRECTFTVQPWIQSAPPKKYLIMANPAHNAPQN